MRARLIAVLILLGLFAQSIALTRHAGMLVSTALAGEDTIAVALVRDLSASMCLPSESVPGPRSLPLDPGKAQSACPICNGLATAFLLAAPDLAVLEFRPVSGPVAFPTLDRRDKSDRHVRPQSRGPPAPA